MIPARHAAVVAWLSKHVGEHEVPMGSNTGPFVRYCQSATWLGGTRWPWCVATWVRAWRDAGHKLPYLGAGAYSMLAWYKKNLPAWVVPLNKARPGSAVVFNIGAGHLGTLVRPYDGSGTVHTIDGNWHNQVSSVAHPVGLVRGVIDPPEGGTPPPAKPPLWEIVTSASGHQKVVFVGGKSQVLKKLAGLFNRYGGLTVRRRKA